MYMYDTCGCVGDIYVTAVGEKISLNDGPPCNQDNEKFVVRCACAANEVWD
jgi:hypothetical protein